MAWRIPVYWPGGDRRGGAGVSLVCSSCAERGKASVDTVNPRRCWRGKRELLPAVDLTGRSLICGDRGQVVRVAGDLDAFGYVLAPDPVEVLVLPRSHGKCAWATNIGSPVAVMSLCSAISEPQSHVSDP